MDTWYYVPFILTLLFIFDTFYVHCIMWHVSYLYALYLVNIYMYTSCSMGHLYINFIMSILSMSCLYEWHVSRYFSGLMFYGCYLMGLWSHIVPFIPFYFMTNIVMVTFTRTIYISSYYMLCPIHNKGLCFDRNKHNSWTVGIWETRDMDLKTGCRGFLAATVLISAYLCT